MTSFEVDPAELNTLAEAVLSMTDGLGSLTPTPVVQTGSRQLDTALTDLGHALDQSLAELRQTLHAHGVNASAAGLWYQRVEDVLATGR